MGFSFKNKGDFRNLEKFLKSMDEGKHFSNVLDRYGQEGVKALAAATPKDTGKTANSWNYKIEKGRGYCKIIFTNSNMDDDGKVPVAILIQYGHGTGTGGYVQGRDYINPAVQPTFDNMAEAVWKEVVNA